MFAKKILFLVLLSLSSLLTAAQDYRFKVPENRCRIEVNKDASVYIEYWITFENIGKPIDVIDVGLPDNQYDLQEVTADLDGVAVTDIRNSTYVSCGVEVHIEGREIQAGSKGTLHLRARARERVFDDDEDKEYASLVFTPTWYGESFTEGTTRLVCEFVFPEGVGPEEPRYHRNQFTDARVEEGRVIYRWEMPEASPSGIYSFGASFPRRVMERVVKGPGPLARFTAAVGALITSSCPCLFFGGFIGIVALFIYNGYRRRLKYLPPSVGMEGVEVRRGLTVPEVAVLMEEKVDKVMSLVLFGMIRKGCVTVESRKPLKLKLNPDKNTAFEYEAEMAKAIKDDGKIDEAEASRVLIELIKRVKDKMKGFSRKKSIKYYKEIMRKAWDQAGSEDYSQAFEWMLLDRDFRKTSTERFPGSTMPVPLWWSSTHWDDGGHLPAEAPPAGGVPAGGAPSAPSMGPVAAANSVVSALEGFSHDLVSSVPGLAGKVTEKTNPVPVSHGSGRSSGGGGCACACACAGCACACAGGGR